MREPYDGEPFMMGRDSMYVDQVVPETGDYFRFVTFHHMCVNCSEAYGMDKRSRRVWQALPGWYGRGNPSQGELFVYDEEG